MKLFFEICKEFFELLYLPVVSDIIENEIIKEEFHEELDEEKGYKEEQEYQEYEHIQNEEQENNQQDIPDIPDIQYKQGNQEKKDIVENLQQEEDDDFCGYELFIKVISFINSRIYKQLNDSKSE
jgi:hypothetical protein